MPPWEEHKARLASDPRANSELIQQTLETDEEELQNSTICVLLARGTEEVFLAARSLLTAGTVAERCLGAKLLGELGLYNYQ